MKPRKKINKTGKKTISQPAATPRAARQIRRQLGYWLLRGLVIFALAVLAYLVYLDVEIRKKFEGQKWALPAHVYTRPMELFVGQRIPVSLIEDELRELGYQARADVDRIGSYTRAGSQIQIYQREFQFWDGFRGAQLSRLTLREGRIDRIETALPGGDYTEIEIIRLEPRLFGSVSPLSHEDRSLLRLEDAPAQLINALIAIEDRQFYSHFGINPVGIMRAMVRNFRAGRVVQGGSTLTQQLIKNYYLTSEQTYKRKINEMLMAILLEIHYSKEAILEAYINEVYLSQAGNRAIHGFALASRYFFGRPLQELDLHQLALLAGINNGPSYYNPIRHPVRALERRNLVLQTMFDEGYIDQQQFERAAAAELDISANVEQAAPLSYPAFMGLVRENLRDDYQQDDLASAGLQIYTTLNPRIQASLQQAAQQQLADIEQLKQLPADSLQVAAVVIRTDNGEVAAMLGDRAAGFSGYNRAMQALRPVGSLLKPFVYLTALESPSQYSLATTISDRSIVVSQQGSPDWAPQNYDGEEHGDIMLIDALAKSYNLATVRLGMELGVERVADTLRRVGYQRDFQVLPSLLLGAVPMSLLDVGQIYLSLASGGFKTPVRAVRSVLDNERQPIGRYPLTVEQVVQPEFSNLINYALQEVIRNGTGRRVLQGFKYDYGLAGKTGTTDDYRDSWFAGFSSNYLTVVWVGRDDNQPTGLTGASGAARVWSSAMQQIPLQRLRLAANDELVATRVAYSLNPDKNDCSLERQLPIHRASLPLRNLRCAKRITYDSADASRENQSGTKKADNNKKRKPWWRRIFGRKKKDG
ncbi:MAG: penicillin-binding protein 1B [Gammaproteobacteria bacterium]|nr:penicillin-binding protein 1B [Gammaproteobacteria bacterium]